MIPALEGLPGLGFRCLGGNPPQLSKKLAAGGGEHGALFLKIFSARLVWFGSCISDLAKYLFGLEVGRSDLLTNLFLEESLWESRGKALIY